MKKQVLIKDSKTKTGNLTEVVVNRFGGSQSRLPSPKPEKRETV